MGAVIPARRESADAIPVALPLCARIDLISASFTCSNEICDCIPERRWEQSRSVSYKSRQWADVYTIFLLRQLTVCEYDTTSARVGG